MTEKTTITVEKDTWKILSQWKLDRNFKTINDLILSLIKEEQIK